jgi:DNA adenine methylase
MLSLENNLHLKPLIKWSGGKSDEIKLFEKYIPDYKTYIEPFVGGGAVFFHLNPQNAVINDIHYDLIAFYREMGLGNNTDIYNFMEEHPNNEETYYNVRDNMILESDLDKAKYFYYLRKTCFRGMLRYNKSGKFNIPYGKYKTINFSSIMDESYVKLLQRTTIENLSFENIFKKYNSNDNFMFIDPPYDSEFTDYGYCQFGKEHHKKLAKLFKKTKNNCLMVIGKTDFISKLYNGYIVSEFDKKYKFKIHSGRIGNEINNKHLIITNYEV